MTTVLLHGFWGQPKDWNAVLERLPLAQSVLAPDLHRPGPLAPTTTLKEWPRRFWHWIEHELGDEPVQLVGYSLGARLALSAVVHAPARVKRALLLSGRPLLAVEQHAARLAWEREFAEAFRQAPWDELEQRWREQPVFHSTSPLPRRHEPELRELLALALTNWSPRAHVFGVEEVRGLPASVEWAFGALDQNYLNVAKDLQEWTVKGQITIIPNVGHRLIADAPDFVGTWIRKEVDEP